MFTLENRMVKKMWWQWSWLWHVCWFAIDLVWVCLTADLLRFSCTTVFRVYTEWYKKGKQFSQWKRLIDERGQWRITERIPLLRHPLCLIVVCRKESQSAQHVEAWDCWATTVEDHAGLYSLSQEREADAAVGTGSTKLDSIRLEKQILMNLNICWATQMVGLRICAELMNSTYLVSHSRLVEVKIWAC